MRRRRFLHLGALVVVVASAGCSETDPRTTPPDDRQVTTVGGEAVEFLLAQVVIRDDLDGPAINYRLRNTGDMAATVKIRTVLAIDGGSSFEQSAYLSVPADNEVTVLYVIVDEARLSDAEIRKIRQSDANFETYLDGERREV